MSDPAIEAAEKILDSVREFGQVGKVGEALVLAAAREVLKPIRAVWKNWNTRDELTSDAREILYDLAPLIYSSEEMER